MWLRIVSALLVVGSVYGAVMQYNDPDSALWVVTYVAAAVIGGLSIFNITFKPLSLVAAAVYFIWCAWIGIKVANEGQAVVDEEGRETGGLLILGLWMLAVSFLAGGSKKT